MKKGRMRNDFLPSSAADIGWPDAKSFLENADNVWSTRAGRVPNMKEK